MKNIILLTITTTFLTACGSKPQGEGASVDPVQANVIRLTPVQYKASNIVLGKLERRPMASHIEVTGKLDVPPQNTAVVAAPLGGFIKTTNLLQGMAVKREMCWQFWKIRSTSSCSKTTWTTAASSNIWKPSMRASRSLLKKM